MACDNRSEPERAWSGDGAHRDTPASDTSRADRGSDLIVGILADPEAAPVDVGRVLEVELGERLAARFEDGRRFDARVRFARLPAGELGSHEEMMAYGSRRRLAEGLVAELATPSRRDGDVPDSVPLGDGALPGPFHVVVPDVEGIDARVVARRGRSRLLFGMVRDNRPWRLVAGLRSAIVAAFAFAAFWMVSPTVWQLAAAHTPWRLAGIALATVTALVVWLVLYHHLWLSTRWRDEARQAQARLFNASTALTLFIGVSCAYAGLVAINLFAAYLVIAPDVLGEYLQQPAGVIDYAKLTWLATSGAAIAGALGTGFESEESVRQAAYSRREQQRRAQLDEEEDTGTDPTDAGQPR